MKSKSGTTSQKIYLQKELSKNSHHDRYISFYTEHNENPLKHKIQAK